MGRSARSDVMIVLYASRSHSTDPVAQYTSHAAAPHSGHLYSTGNPSRFTRPLSVSARSASIDLSGSSMAPDIHIERGVSAVSASSEDVSASATGDSELMTRADVCGTGMNSLPPTVMLSANTSMSPLTNRASAGAVGRPLQAARRIRVSMLAMNRTVGWRYDNDDEVSHPLSRGRELSPPMWCLVGCIISLFQCSGEMRLWRRHASVSLANLLSVSWGWLKISIASRGINPR